MRSLFTYYGGKGMLSSRYPKPTYELIIEPFAGGSTYAAKYYNHDVLLYEINRDVVDMLRFVQNVSKSDIDIIPKNVKQGDSVRSIIEKMGGCPNGLEYILRSHANLGVCGTAKMCGIDKITKIGAACWYRNTHKKLQFWIGKIKHWKIIHDTYLNCPDITACWFIDPPYNNNAGKRYKFNNIDYMRLSKFVKSRSGQIIVCENFGADWLDFKKLRGQTPGINRKDGNIYRKQESIYYNFQ